MEDIKKFIKLTEALYSYELSDEERIEKIKDQFDPNILATVVLEKIEDALDKPLAKELMEPFTDKDISKINNLIFKLATPEFTLRQGENTILGWIDLFSRIGVRDLLKFLSSKLKPIESTMAIQPDKALYESYEQLASIFNVPHEYMGLFCMFLAHDYIETNIIERHQNLGLLSANELGYNIPNRIFILKHPRNHIKYISDMEAAIESKKINVFRAKYKLSITEFLTEFISNNKLIDNSKFRSEVVAWAKRQQK